MTYDCGADVLLSIDVCSKKASPESCATCPAEAKRLFFQFLGAEVASMLDAQSIEILNLQWGRWKLSEQDDPLPVNGWDF